MQRRTWCQITEYVNVALGSVKLFGTPRNKTRSYKTSCCGGCKGRSSHRSTCSRYSTPSYVISQGVSGAKRAYGWLPGGIATLLPPTGLIACSVGARSGNRSCEHRGLEVRRVVPELVKGCAALRDVRRFRPHYSKALEG